MKIRNMYTPINLRLTLKRRSDVHGRVGIIRDFKLLSVHHYHILTDKRDATEDQSCFIQAVISSNYVKINQQNYLQLNLKQCAAVRSNRRKPRPKFDVSDAKFEFEFPEYLDTWKDIDGRR